MEGGAWERGEESSNLLRAIESRISYHLLHSSLNRKDKLSLSRIT